MLGRRTNPFRIDNGVGRLNSLQPELFIDGRHPFHAGPPLQDYWSDIGNESTAGNGAVAAHPAESASYKNSYNNRGDVIRNPTLLQKSLEYLTDIGGYIGGLVPRRVRPLVAGGVLAGTVLAVACTPGGGVKNNPPPTHAPAPTQQGWNTEGSGNANASPAPAPVIVEPTPVQRRGEDSTAEPPATIESAPALVPPTVAPAQKPTAKPANAPIIEPNPTSTPTATPVALESRILKDLLFYVPELSECNGDEQHRRVISAIVTRIKEDLYDNGLVRNENEAWEKYIGPAVKFVTPNICIIDLSKWTQTDISQVTLPPQLRNIRILQPEGQNSAVGVSDVFVTGLEIGIENVTYNPRLRKSPQEWLRDVMREEYEVKGARYRNALDNARIPITKWPKSLQWYQPELEKVTMEDYISVFILGNGAIHTKYIGDPVEDRVEPIIPMSEQATPHYAVLIGRSFMRPTYLRTAVYPRVGGKHQEQSVMLKDGRLFGIWENPEAFKLDYEGQMPELALTLYPKRN